MGNCLLDAECVVQTPLGMAFFPFDFPSLTSNDRLSISSSPAPIIATALSWPFDAKDKLSNTSHVLRSQGSKFHFLLAYQYFLITWYVPTPFSITWLYHLTAYLSFLPCDSSLAVHMTHTDSNPVVRILGITCESVRLGMTPYFVQWLITSTGTSSIRLESWQLPRCI